MKVLYKTSIHSIRLLYSKTGKYAYIALHLTILLAAVMLYDVQIYQKSFYMFEESFIFSMEAYSAKWNISIFYDWKL